MNIYWEFEIGSGNLETHSKRQSRSIFEDDMTQEYTQEESIWHWHRSIVNSNPHFQFEILKWNKYLGSHNNISSWHFATLPVCRHSSCLWAWSLSQNSKRHIGPGAEVSRHIGTNVLKMLTGDSIIYTMVYP